MHYNHITRLKSINGSKALGNSAFRCDASTYSFDGLYRDRRREHAKVRGDSVMTQKGLPINEGLVLRAISGGNAPCRTSYFVTLTPEANPSGVLLIRRPIAQPPKWAVAQGTCSIAAMKEVGVQSSSRPYILRFKDKFYPATRAKHAIMTFFAPALFKTATQALVVAPLVKTSSTRSTLAPRTA